jgi:hypothetical protein
MPVRFLAQADQSHFVTVLNGTRVLHGTMRLDVAEVAGENYTRASDDQRLSMRTTWGDMRRAFDHHPGTPWERAFGTLDDGARVLLTDALVLDPRPDACWRCDAVEASSPVGLCELCHRELVS